MRRAGKTWKKISLNFLSRLKETGNCKRELRAKRSSDRTLPKKLLSKYSPMRICLRFPRPLTGRMVVFIPRTESSNTTLPLNVFFTHGRCQYGTVFHGWHVGEGCYGNCLSWYPTMNTDFFQWKETGNCTQEAKRSPEQTVPNNWWANFHRQEGTYNFLAHYQRWWGLLC